jgi:hypothetical protein
MGSVNQGDLNQGPPGRNWLSVPRGTVERKIENRLSPMRVLDAWPALKNPGRNLRSYACESVQAFHVEHVKLCALRFDAESLPSLKTSPLWACEMDVVFHVERLRLLKWARKSWPIDCDASAILAMRPAPNYVVANHNRFALCCEQLRFS